MAILTDKYGQIEVRIKRCADGTYFGEYVKTEHKIEGHEGPERYIVMEPGATWSAEIIFQAGYSYENCSSVDAFLRFPRHIQVISSVKFETPEHGWRIGHDLTKELRHADVRKSGNPIHGSAFTFRDLQIDLGHVMVEIVRYSADSDLLSSEEYDEQWETWGKECAEALSTTPKT
ncbi:hypothetical protein ACMFMG_004705 [Clarireedia jacksonii]